MSRTSAGIFLLFFFTVFLKFSSAQSEVFDSLNALLSGPLTDSARMVILNEMTAESEDEDIVIYARKTEEINTRLLKNCKPGTERYRFLMGIKANIHHNLGYYYGLKTQAAEEIKEFTIALACAKIALLKEDISMELNSLSSAYHEAGDLENALAFGFEGLKYREQQNDKIGVATSHINLASIYDELGYDDKQEEALIKAINSLKETDKKSFLATALNNLGQFYSEKRKYDMAYARYKEALQYINPKNKKSIAMNYHNQANVYFYLTNKDSSLALFDISIEIAKESGDEVTLANCLIGAGSTQLRTEDVKAALRYANEIEKINLDKAGNSFLRRCNFFLYKVYKESGDFSKSLIAYEKFISISDTINSEENKKAGIKSQLKYEYEKKAAADSVRVEQEKKVTAAQLKTQKQQFWFLITGLVFVVAGLFFVVFRFRESQKQKKMIEMQKSIVDEKQKEILDSIHYAKRIQQALMPNDAMIERELRKAGRKKMTNN